MEWAALQIQKNSFNKNFHKKKKKNWIKDGNDKILKVVQRQLVEVGLLSVYSSDNIIILNLKDNSEQNLV